MFMNEYWWAVVGVLGMGVTSKTHNDPSNSFSVITEIIGLGYGNYRRENPSHSHLRFL
jgi:hypothetical protein